MCGSMVAIQSAMAENRQGKKKKPQDENRMACPIWHYNNIHIVSQKELHVANLNIFYSYTVSQKKKLMLPMDVAHYNFNVYQPIFGNFWQRCC